MAFNLKTTELLDCVLIRVCAVIGSNVGTYQKCIRKMLLISSHSIYIYFILFYFFFFVEK